MNSDLLEYYYQSAKSLLKNGKLFGESINVENEKEVIAALYIIWLEHDQLKKEMEREFINSVQVH